MLNLNFNFLGIAFTGIKLIHLLGFPILILLSYFSAKRTYKKIINTKVLNQVSKFTHFMLPILTYLYFIINYLVFSLLTFYLTGSIGPMKVFNLLAFGLFMTQLLFLLTRSLILCTGVLLSFVALLYLESIQFIKETVVFLNSLSIKIGQYHLTPISILKALITITLFIVATNFISTQFKKLIRKKTHLQKTTTELIFKSFDIVLYCLAFLVTLNFLGINLSTLAVIGGALSVGLGFGLQKITSNFVSGIILLFERSIEVDDLIEMDGGIYGYIKKLGSRYTIVEMFDGKEVLIPNEDFITSRVVNWTYSNKKGRVELAIGVSYNADIKLAKELILQAMKEYPSSLDAPEPVVYLREFADSSVNFTAFFFISDVTKGRFEPQSVVMFSIWDKFKANGIEIPFPQQDIHIKTSTAIGLKNENSI